MELKGTLKQVLRERLVKESNVEELLRYVRGSYFREEIKRELAKQPVVLRLWMLAQEPKLKSLIDEEGCHLVRYDRLKFYVARRGPTQCQSPTMTVEESGYLLQEGPDLSVTPVRYDWYRKVKIKKSEV
ncbi:MAG: hypothetical protein ACYCQJ_13255 [Nitrososphaerales archaeon]